MAASNLGGQIPLILDGSFFTICTRGNEGDVTANCMACGKTFKGRISTTSNFTSHLQRVILSVFIKLFHVMVGKY